MVLTAPLKDYTHTKQELVESVLRDKTECGKAGQVTSETVPLGWLYRDWIYKVRLGFHPGPLCPYPLSRDALGLPYPEEDGCAQFIAGTPPLRYGLMSTSECPERPLSAREKKENVNSPGHFHQSGSPLLLLFLICPVKLF